jgi:hypothetical protein
MKRAALAATVALAACGGHAPAGHGGGATMDGRIECRTGDAPFARACTVEEAESGAGRVLTLRKPDGGFRRLLVTRDGRGVIAADGAEPARVGVIDDRRIEVTIGADAFRLPATIAPR